MEKQVPKNCYSCGHGRVLIKDGSAFKIHCTHNNSRFLYNHYCSKWGMHPAKKENRDEQ